jgi:hypothetical protein
MGAQVESDLSEHDLDSRERRNLPPWLVSAAPTEAKGYEYELAVSALRKLPDHCAADVSELASRIGAQKLMLISWLRADHQFAHLVASKVSG